MATRPTIALTLIAKNEVHNLPILLSSVENCFDEIYLTDTGSTDGTVDKFLEIGQDHDKRFGTKFHVVNFDWCDDFSAARNAALPLIRTDYWMWMDLDDSLDDAEKFIEWRNEVMRFSNYAMASYHYAVEMATMKPLITFARERVFKTSMGYRFNCPVHEGVKPVQGTAAIHVVTWSIKHRRSKEDLEKDKGRNLRILEKNKATLDPRLRFYLGKELFENNRSQDALHVLKDVVTLQELEFHDKIMSYQYLCLSIMAESEKLKPEYKEQSAKMYVDIISLAHQALILDPQRAEFLTIIGDCYLKLGRLEDALPSYAAAKSLISKASSFVAEANHRVKNVYQEYPRNMIAKIYFNMGKIDEALLEVNECLKLFPESKEAIDIKKELEKLAPLMDLKSEKQKVPDIVISCPPQDLMEWDSKVYKEKKIGGSETAVVEMSQWLKRLTNRPVKVFNCRKEAFTDEVGVEYIPNNPQLNEYMSTYEPAIHIAHRHNIKVTNAKTYLWCHDLQTQGCDVVQNFDHIFCLSPFHARYVHSLQGIPKDKIIQTRNGIRPDRFKNKTHIKNPNKVVFPSSPDRGLAEAIYIVEKARKVLPDLELHAYYGFENLRLCGLAPLADKLEELIKDRPWVKYHGGVKQDVLAKEMGEAVVWLYPASFIESYCITALESACSGVYSICRDLGALPDTLRPFTDKGMAEVLDIAVESEEDQQIWADHLVDAIKNEKWKNVAVSPDDYSWQNVAKSWLQVFEL